MMHKLLPNLAHKLRKLDRTHTSLFKRECVARTLSTSAGIV